MTVLTFFALQGNDARVMQVRLDLPLMGPLRAGVGMQALPSGSERKKKLRGGFVTRLSLL